MSPEGSPTPLPQTNLKRTALRYDPGHTVHESPGHPEQPARLEAIVDALDASSMADRLIRVEPREASLGELQRVHDPAYISYLRSLRPRGLHMIDADTYLTAQSMDLAVRAAGGGIACVDAVLNGYADNAFALTRPPGHHARIAQAMGFCLINNIAVAARHAENQYGVDRVAIVDFDVHHGNGTQDVFYEDGRVLFASVHQSPLFPGTGEAGEQGAGDGLGSTLNVPLPAWCGDAVYRRVFDELLEARIGAFRPDLLLVSAGYDAHWRDPLAGMRVSTTGFADLVSRLVRWADAWCGGRLVCFLEGGYDLAALSASVIATLQRLQDPEATVRDDLGPSPSTERYPEAYLDALIASLS